MLYINEWLPNPVGNDAAGEFVELYNSGAAAVSLDGYALGTGAKKTAKLSGRAVAAGGYLVLMHADTKLSLKNSDGALFLYGPDGGVVDAASFAGAAPTGKSWSRVSYGAAPIGHFAFTYPTPGAENRAIDTAVTVRDYPYGVSLSHRLSPVDIIMLMLGGGVFFLAFSFYAFKKNRNLSDLFFPRDAGARS